MADKEQIAIFGVGGFGREVAWLAAEVNRCSPTSVVCFVGRGDEIGHDVHGTPVLTASAAYERFPNASVIRLGNHVQINLDCTVGHDTVMEDYVTLAPGVHISGRVKICKGAYVGTGASVIPNVTIGAGATVGAGAVVVRDVPPGETHVGIPAKAVNRDKAARSSGP